MLSLKGGVVANVMLPTPEFCRSRPTRVGGKADASALPDGSGVPLQSGVGWASPSAAQATTHSGGRRDPAAHIADSACELVR